MQKNKSVITSYFTKQITTAVGAAETAAAGIAISSDNNVMSTSPNAMVIAAETTALEPTKDNKKKRKNDETINTNPLSEKQINISPTPDSLTSLLNMDWQG